MIITDNTILKKLVKYLAGQKMPLFFQKSAQLATPKIRAIKKKKKNGGFKIF